MEWIALSAPVVMLGAVLLLQQVEDHLPGRSHRVEDPTPPVRLGGVGDHDTAPQES